MLKKCFVCLFTAFTLAACATTTRVPAAYVVYVPPEAKMPGKYAVIMPTNRHTDARLTDGGACDAFAVGETVSSAITKSLEIFMDQLVDTHVVLAAPLTQAQLVAGGYAGMFMFDGMGAATPHFPADFTFLPDATTVVDTAIMSQVVGVDGAANQFLLLGRGMSNVMTRGSCERSEVALNHAFAHSLEGVMGSFFHVVVESPNFKAFKNREEQRALEL